MKMPNARPESVHVIVPYKIHWNGQRAETWPISLISVNLGKKKITINKIVNMFTTIINNLYTQ